MQDAVTIAAMMGVIMALIKILEIFCSWLLNKLIVNNDVSKNNKDHIGIVMLDSEYSKLVRETYDMTLKMKDIIVQKDLDGAPLVYYPRSVVDEQKKVCGIIKDISSLQEKELDLQEQINDNVIILLKIAKTG
jgi:hypothetical protein